MNLPFSKITATSADNSNSFSITGNLVYTQILEKSVYYAKVKAWVVFWKPVVSIYRKM